MVVENVLESWKREELHNVVTQYGLNIGGGTSTELVEGLTWNSVSAENNRGSGVFKSERNRWFHRLVIRCANTNRDITDAECQIRWNDPCNMVYVAVKITDTSPLFEASWNDWYTSDGIGIYVQGDPNGGTWYGTGGTLDWMVAQAYVVKKATSGASEDAWTAWDNGSGVAGDADFTGKATYNSTTKEVSYEVSLRAWERYNGISGWNGGVSVPEDLEVGMQMGLDITGTTGNAVAANSDVICYNQDYDKYSDAGTFQKFTLISGSPACGDWGYQPEDISENCFVDLDDVAMILDKWMKCNDPLGCP